MSRLQDLIEEIRGEAPQEERPPEPPPARKRTVRSRRWRRPSLLPLLGVAAAILAAIVVAILLWWPEGAPSPPERAGTALGAGEQHVVAWFVSDERGADDAFVAVVASGGDRPPVVLGVPSYTVTNIPGYGTAAIADPIASPAPAAAARAVENVLGIRLDAWTVSDVEEVAEVVDAVGGVEVSDGPLDGDGVVAVLRRGGDDPLVAELRFVRWQEVVAGLLRSADGRAHLLRPLGRDVAQVLVAAGRGGAQVVELPVQDIGSGLARPDAEATGKLVEEWFVPTARTTQDVRLVVMNGVGTPGVADRVARVLVPSGFELVSSLNADTFDREETQIVAANESFLPEAELARELLGTGKVSVGTQPTGLADVTVIVGSDFGGR